MPVAESLAKPRTPSLTIKKITYNDLATELTDRVVLFSHFSITELYLSLINRTFARKKNKWETDY